MVLNRFCNPSFLEIYFTFWVWNFFNFAVNTTKNWNVVCSQWEPFVLTALNYLLTGLIHSNKKVQNYLYTRLIHSNKKDIFVWNGQEQFFTNTKWWWMSGFEWKQIEMEKKKFWFSLKIWPKILKNVIFLTILWDQSRTK
jgi:hypothetical protein